jgi:hypothetical protein
MGSDLSENSDGYSISFIGELPKGRTERMYSMHLDLLGAG